ncbi:ABC transporter permease [Streptomyces beihaiensis]|uniref:Oligopeptide transport system permease protein OppC n=1 Tax=Streptomyces beihaiensis TaxID=2984495 RepID=A0ABT3TNR0_9ACTN|nr:ABC transporter permease [Streptomyces beihaiensis]MCX3058685.1 ABC transporter permease [Streptomyces beihaiensis]
MSGVRAWAAGRPAAARLGLALIALLCLYAFVGPHLSPHSPTDIDYTALSAGPGARHWFGTNRIGQDVFAQTARGLQKSLLISVSVSAATTALAALVGTCAGYFGGWTDHALTFLVDLLLVVPGFLVLVVVASRLRNAGWPAYAAAIAALGWMVTARAVRAMARSLRERPYVRAARHMGVRPLRIVRGHLLPHLAPFLITHATIAAAAAVVAEAGLSFVGFGVQPPDVSLGTLMADSAEVALTYPWMFFFPTGMLLCFVLAVNLVGEALRTRLDPVAAWAAVRR